MTNKTNDTTIRKPVVRIQANHLSISSTNLYVLEYLARGLNGGKVGITYRNFWRRYD